MRTSHIMITVNPKTKDEKPVLDKINSIYYELQSKMHSIVFNKNNRKINVAIDDQNYEILYRQNLKPKSKIKTIGMPWVENSNIRLNQAYFFNF